MRDEVGGSARSREASVPVEAALSLAAAERHVDEAVMNPKNLQ